MSCLNFYYKLRLANVNIVTVLEILSGLLCHTCRFQQIDAGNRTLAITLIQKSFNSMQN